MNALAAMDELQQAERVMEDTKIISEIKMLKDFFVEWGADEPRAKALAIRACIPSISVFVSDFCAPQEPQSKD